MTSWPKKVKDCDHPINRHYWTRWRDALTIGRQYRRLRCHDCGHWIKSQNRAKP